MQDDALVEREAGSNTAQASLPIDAWTPPSVRPPVQAARLDTGDELVAFADTILARQAFSTRLGTELVAFVPGRAELALRISDDLRQQHGYVHGGVLAYLADSALTFAAGSVLGDCVTVEFKINYLRPAVGDGRLIAVADVLSHGRSIAVAQCQIFREEPAPGRELCAVAQGTLKRRARSKPSDMG